MANPNDESLARIMQSQEFRTTTSVSPASQIQRDEEYARQLLLEEQRQQQQQPQNIPQVPLNQNVVSLHPGQKTMIRLHSPITNRQIGEIVIAQYYPGNEMAFEHSKIPGKYLKARPSGILEFDNGCDDKAIFRVIPTNNGVVYLLSKGFINNINRQGTKGWYLSMSSDGCLSCQGCQDRYSEWLLLSANAQLPQSPAVQAPIFQTISTQPPQYQPSTNVTNSIVNFPGLASGREVLTKYFGTQAGIQFLNGPDYTDAKTLHEQGVLSKILHRPDWPFIAHRFKDYQKEKINFDQQYVDRSISFQELKSFFDNGYVEIPGKLLDENIKEALKLCNYWLFKYSNQTPSFYNALRAGKNYTLELSGDITQDFDILSLYYLSPIPHILECLMGANEVAHPTTANIIMTFPCMDPTDSSALLGDKWYIEGFTDNGDHSPYSVLVGVALTDITDIDQGNFCVHPGSHLILLEQYKDRALRKSTFFSENPYVVQKPDLGVPTQLQLKAGDAFICTQRLAILNSKNLLSMPTAIVYFKVSHIDHDVLKEPALQSLWLEFKNASIYLEDSNCIANSTAPFN